MKSFVAVLSYFAVTALATPAGQAKKAGTVNINLANDQSGQNGVATIAINGVDHPIAKLFAGTGIANAGFQASSAQLNAFPQTGFTCSIKNPAQAVVGVLTVQQTYADLDGNPNVLSIIKLKGGSINCS
jgi:hypothetical protein